MRRNEWWILGAAIALGALVRFATLDLQSFHHDEAVTALRVLPGSFGEMLDQLVDSERSGPLYYAIAWVWSQPFGLGEVGLRSLSAVIGTLTIPAAWLAARELASPRAGLIAAAFVAASPILVWYSQEARSYGLLVLFATLALAYMARARRTRAPGDHLLWAVCGALALASHYFAVFVLVPQAAWLWWRGDRRQTGRAIAGLAAAGVALAALAFAQQEGRGSAGLFTDRSLLFRTGETAIRFMTFEEPGPLAGNAPADLIQVGTTVAGWALIALLVLWGARRAAPHREAVLAAAGIGAFGIVAPLLAAAIGLDYFNPRNMLAAWVPFLVAAAIAASAAGLRSAPAAGVGALLGVFGVLGVATVTSAQFQRDDWREAADAIGEPRGPRLIVANLNGDDPLLLYLGAERFDKDGWGEGIEVRDLVTLSKNPSVRPPRGFELVDTEGLKPNFVLKRFRSDRPVHLTPADVRADKVLLVDRSGALVDGLE